MVIAFVFVIVFALVAIAAVTFGRQSVGPEYGFVEESGQVRKSKLYGRGHVYEMSSAKRNFGRFAEIDETMIFPESGPKLEKWVSYPADHDRHVREWENGEISSDDFLQW